MILLNPNATQTLGLALHELRDYARKHGALSNDAGDVVSFGGSTKAEPSPTSR